MPVRGVIFDLDGTLVRFTFQPGRVKHEIIELARRHKAPGALLDPATAIGPLRDSVQAALRLRDGAPAARRFYDATEEILERFEMAAATATSLRDGAEETLRTLREMGVGRVLLTNAGPTPLRLLMDKFGLAALLEQAYSRRDVPKEKPDPAGVRFVLDQMGWAAGESLLVGDSKVDVRAAAAAGVRPVGVLGGSSPEADLRAAGADDIVSGLDAIPGLVRALDARRGSPR